MVNQISSIYSGAGKLGGIKPTITVHTLIEELKKYSPYTLVHIKHMDDGGYYSGDSPVTNIEHSPLENKIIMR